MVTPKTSYTKIASFTFQYRQVYGCILTFLIRSSSDITGPANASPGIKQLPSVTSI
jgi:hypothetical protein